MVSCNYDGNKYINSADTLKYFTAVKARDLANGDFNNDGYVNSGDTLIYFKFVKLANIENIYPAVVVE